MLNAVYTILVSFVLAMVFNLLFFQHYIGISLFIFFGTFLSVIYMFGIRLKLPVQKTLWLAILIVFFALMPAIRANEFLVFMDICAILGLLMLMAHGITGTPAFVMRIRDYIILLVFVPLRMLISAVSTFTLIGKIHSRVKNREIWIRIIKGVIMAVPVLIIFGALFSQADLAFSKFINDFLNITISELTLQYLVLLTISFTGALCFLSYIGSPRREIPEWFFAGTDSTPPPGRTDRGIEVLVFLGLISALFLLFIGFQVAYLFGGESNIISAGFTYAEYARKGFWELLTVAFLSLLVLLSSEKIAGAESRKDRRFMIPALILIFEVGIIISSAYKRLSLYIDAYGMTAQRFYAGAFIVLISVLFILLAIKFITYKRDQYFIFGTLLSVVAFLIAVNLINPDAYIARSNFERFIRTGKIDVDYNKMLSADSVPWNVMLYGNLAGEEKDAMKKILENQYDRLLRIGEDWQSANLSRSRALKLLQGVLIN